MCRSKTTIASYLAEREKDEEKEIAAEAAKKLRTKERDKALWLVKNAAWHQMNMQQQNKVLATFKDKFGTKCAADVMEFLDKADWFRQHNGVPSEELYAVLRMQNVGVTEWKEWELGEPSIEGDGDNWEKWKTWAYRTYIGTKLKESWAKGMNELREGNLSPMKLVAKVRQIWAHTTGRWSRW